MTTLTTRFPEKVAFGFSGGARYSTSIAVSGSGHEKRNQNWSQSRGRWTATHAGKNETDTQALVKHFHAAGGMLNNFPFKDPTDYQVVTAEGILTLVSSGIYQLYKRYSSGGVNRDYKVVRPVNAVAAGGGSYSISATTGLLTHSSGSAPTSWSGEFDRLCRYDSDELNIELVNGAPGHRLYSWGNIAIVEDKV